MMFRSQIVGCGAYLPERIVTNEELATRLDTSDAWIRQRTGIGQRRIAADGELTSDLAYHAARQALERAGMNGNDLDLLVLATATPDETFPATAVKVQARLGMTRGAAFDVQAVCSGFIFALAESGPMQRGILSTHLHSDGRQHDILYVDGGPSSTRETGYLRMQGREVFRQAVHHLSSVVDEALAANGLAPSDIDWLVPHQANTRIIEAVGRKLGLDAEKTVLTIERHANTSAASIPLALDEAVRDGRIRPGHIVLMEALGGGLTWGASIARW